MDQNPRSKSMGKLCEGVVVPIFIPEESLRSALNYEPKKGDIFVVSFPQCGTSWMQYTVSLILRHGKPVDDPFDFTLCSPSIEIWGAAGLDHMIHPGTIKTHLPYEKIPKSKDAKYIYFCRNPKDCVVSFYYYMKDMPMPGLVRYNFDEVFEYFVTGNVPYGDYFDHIMAWYEHRNEPNIYIVTYERLQKDIRGEILKLAKFIGEEYENVLLNEPGVLDDVIKHSSMKNFTYGSTVKVLEDEVTASDGKELPPVVVKTSKPFVKKDDEKSKKHPSLQFVRKGIVGDLKNHLKPDQLRRIEERIEEKTANSEVMSLWQ